MTPRAVDKLVEDARVIRSRSKIEATIENAENMLALDAEHKTFKRYLHAHADFESTSRICASASSSSATTARIASSGSSGERFRPTTNGRNREG